MYMCVYIYIYIGPRRISLRPLRTPIKFEPSDGVT